MPEKEFDIHHTAEIRLSKNDRFTALRGGIASIGEGMSHIFDFMGTTSEVVFEKSNEDEIRSDWEAIHSDWIAVGNDMRFIMSQMEQIIEHTPALRDHPLNNPPKQ
jgi:hypothetical protein